MDTRIIGPFQFCFDAINIQSFFLLCFFLSFVRLKRMLAVKNGVWNHLKHWLIYNISVTMNHKDKIGDSEGGPREESRVSDKMFDYLSKLL